MSTRTAAGTPRAWFVFDEIQRIPGLFEPIELGAGEIWAAGIKRSTAPRVSRGFRSACENLRPTRKLVVYPGRERFSLGRGIEAVPLSEVRTASIRRHE